MDATEGRARVAQEAASWWTRIGNRDPREISAADRMRFTQWMRESPLHVAEMLYMAHVHDVLGRFKGWTSLHTIGTSDAEKVVSIHRRSSMRFEPPHADPRHSPRIYAAIVLATIILIVCCVRSAGWIGYSIETGQAERREMMLQDGSVVRLEPETMLRVRFSSIARGISLERGRVLFHVAKDPQRPFSVRLGRAVVRAVGTEFGVERNRNEIVVTVAEGRVAVLPGVLATAPMPTALPDGSVGMTGTADNSRQPAVAAQLSREPVPGRQTDSRYEPNPIFLVAGEQLRLQRAGAVEPVRDVEPTRALAWSAGKLIFDGISLADAVEEFNRYNHLQLRIMGPELERRLISGVFQASDPETFIAFVRAGTPVNVRREAPDRVVITPSP